MKSKIVLLVALMVAVVLGGLACSHTAVQSAAKRPLYYTCPMHPSERLDKPGVCPICGMNLVPVYADEKAAPAPSCCATTTVTNQP